MLFRIICNPMRSLIVIAFTIWFVMLSFRKNVGLFWVFLSHHAETHWNFHPYWIGTCLKAAQLCLQLSRIPLFRLSQQLTGYTTSSLVTHGRTYPGRCLPFHVFCIDASCASNRENYTLLCFPKFNWSFNMQSYAFH